MPKFEARRIKPIVLALKGPMDFCDDRIDLSPAPDGQHVVAFSHGLELTMMNYRYWFTLLDRKLNVVQAFRGLATIHTGCAWSSDSAIFAVVGSDWGGLFLWHVAREEFTIVRTTGRQFDFEFKRPAALRIWFDREQLRVMNIAPGGKIMPIYRAPDDAVVDTATLKWHPRPTLKKLDSVAKAAPVVAMRAIKNKPARG